MAENLYGLFKPVTLPTGKRRYERVAGTAAYRRPVAVRVFQDRLIFEGLCLRPVKEAKPAPTTTVHAELGQCKSCYDHLHTSCERGDCQCNCRMFQRAGA